MAPLISDPINDVAMSDAQPLEPFHGPAPPGLRHGSRDYMAEIAAKCTNPALAAEAYQQIPGSETQYISESDVAKAKQVYRTKSRLQKAITDALVEEQAHMQSFLKAQIDLDAQIAQTEAEQAMNRRLWDKFLAEKPERERKRAAKRQARVGVSGDDRGMIE